MKNEELLKRLISQITLKDYPFIKEINVTSEYSLFGGYVDEERNTTYNVWFEIGDYEPFDDWKGLEDSVISLRNALGLRGHIRFYYTDSELDFYDDSE